MRKLLLVLVSLLPIMVSAENFELRARDIVTVTGGSNLTSGAQDVSYNSVITSNPAIFSSGPTTLYIINTGDSSNVLATVRGLDSSWAEQYQSITLTRHTVLPYTYTALDGRWRRINDISTNKKSDGDIIISLSPSGNPFDSTKAVSFIPKGLTQSYNFVFTVPAKYEATLERWECSTVFSKGYSTTTGYPALAAGVLYRPNGSSSWNVLKEIVLESGSTYEQAYPDVTIIPARADCKVAASVTPSNMDFRTRCIFTTRKSVSE